MEYYPEKITFNLTSEHFKNANYMLATRCPIAKAIEKIHPELSFNGDRRCLVLTEEVRITLLNSPVCIQKYKINKSGYKPWHYAFDVFLKIFIKKGKPIRKITLSKIY